MLQLLSKQPNSRPKWLVDQTYTIGSGPDCGIVIRDANVQKCHGKLSIEGLEAKIYNLVGDKLIRVNGVPVAEARSLKPGDVLGVGITELELIDSRQVKPQPPKKTKDKTAAWVLKPTGAALAGREFPITDEAAIVGRSKDCDISLAIAHLSRKHARLQITEHGLLVEDLNSANGTFVNGQKIERAILKPGDDVRFDSINFCVAGPHQDTDLTTVRPVLRVASSASGSTPAPAPAPIQQGGVPPKLASHKVAKSASAAHSTAQASVKISVNGEPYSGVVTASGASLLTEKTHRSSSAVIWLIMSVALVATAWYLLH